MKIPEKQRKASCQVSLSPSKVFITQLAPQSTIISVCPSSLSSTFHSSPLRLSTFKNAPTTADPPLPPPPRRIDRSAFRRQSFTPDFFGGKNPIFVAACLKRTVSLIRPARSDFDGGGRRRARRAAPEAALVGDLGVGFWP